MIAQRRDKTTPGSFLAGVLTQGIFYDSRRILKGPCYSYSNYLIRFLFFSLSVCLSEVIFTWHFPRSQSAEFSQKEDDSACQPTDFSTFSPIETLIKNWIDIITTQLNVKVETEMVKSKTGEETKGFLWELFCEAAIGFHISAE